MPGPVSRDLRERVIEAIDPEKLTQAQIASRLKWAIATVKRPVRRKRETGDVAPKPRGGQRVGLNHEDLEALKKLVEDRPDQTLVELEEAFEEKTQQPTSPAEISRGLKKL